MLPGLSTDEHKLLLLSVGSHKKRRLGSPMQIAEIFDKAIQHGATLKDCANAVYFDGTSMISRFLRLLRLVPELKLLVDWGQSGVTMGFTASHELARLEADDQIIASRLILQNQLTKKEVEKVVRLKLKTNCSVNECIDQILRLRPKVVKKNVYLGAVTFDKLQAYLLRVSQNERDLLLKQALQSRLPQLENYVCRLSSERFLIVGGDEVEKILDSIDEGFESFVNLALERNISKDG